MSNDRDYIIRQIREKVNELDSSAEVILYGSRARGDCAQDSDWDLLILLQQDGVDKGTEQIFRHHLFDLELEIGVPISVFVYSKEDWEGKYSVTPFFKNVRHEGISLL